MVKKVLVISVLAFLIGIFGVTMLDYVFAEGINPHATGYITSTKDTIGVLAVDVLDYTKMKFWFYILDPDTLRTDTLRLSLQHSDSPWTGYTTFFADVITQLDNVVCTLSYELNTDTLFIYGTKHYIRWYAVFGDSNRHRDTELVRPGGDTTPEDWSLSTGSDSYALIDEAATDTTDYIYVTATDLFTTVTVADHETTEITVDSVEFFVVPKYYLVGSETIAPDADAFSQWVSTDGSDVLYTEIDESSPDLADYMYVTGTFSEVIRPDADAFSQWLSTDGGDVLYTEIDEASPSVADYMYIEDKDSLAVIGFADQASAGNSIIDSVVLSYLVEYGTALCSIEVALCVTDASGCDTCDCSATDSIALTADSVRHSFMITTSPRTASALTSDELDSMTAIFRTFAVAVNGTAYVHQVYPDIYYTPDVESLAVIGFADQASAGTATIDSVVLSFLHENGVATCSLDYGLCVTDAVGCDSCDCSTGTRIEVTGEDSVRQTFNLATSPRTGLAWTADEVDSLNGFFRSVYVATNGTLYVQWTSTGIYYSDETASFKYGICIKDTSACIWSDSTALDTATVFDTVSVVATVSPSSDSAFTVFQVDSLVGTVKSHHITSGSMRVLNEWFMIYYNAGDMSPPLHYEARAILKE